MNRPGENKPNPSLLLEDFGPALLKILEAIEYGAAKHGIRDWQKHPANQYKEAYYRHSLKGLDLKDEESKLLHIDHMMADLLMYRMQLIRGVGHE